MERIFVSVKPGAREPGVTQVAEKHLRVAVREPAQGGRANEAVRSALARHFGVPRSAVRIKSGHASRRKIIEIG